MIVEIGAPSVLSFGLIKAHTAAGPRILQLVLSIQHPPVHLSMAKRDGLSVTGPRAHVADGYARRFLSHHGITSGAIIEIELAIPSLVGLRSDAMLGLSVARGLANLYGLEVAALALARAIGLDDAQAGGIWAFEKGGLLLLDTHSGFMDETCISVRLEIAHPEKDAWAFILYFPYPPENTPEEYEALTLQTLLDSGRDERLPEVDMDVFVRAVREDRFEDFAAILMDIQQANQVRLAETAPFEPPAGREALFRIMEAGGAVAWGQTPGGFSFWGLVKGGNASRRIRKALQDHVGFFGGRVMATILDNRGANLVENPGELGYGPGMRPRPGVSSSRD